jgi:hypothetical protein
MSRYLTVALCAGVVQAASAQVTRSVDRRMVTGAAAAALKADGTFALPDSVVHPPGQLGQEDAVAFVEEIQRYSRPCGRPVYARSAVEPLGTEVSPMTRRRFGPHWIVALCDPGGGRPTAIETFSALATEVRASSQQVRDRGMIVSDLMSHRYPAAASPDMFSPEGVARFAFEETGRRVAAVPDLIDVLPPASNAALRWRVMLESPVLVRSQRDTTPRSRSVLFVGFSRIFLRSGLLDVVPARSPWPDSVLTDYLTHAPYKVILERGVPDSLELVTVVK